MPTNRLALATFPKAGGDNQDHLTDPCRWSTFSGEIMATLLATMANIDLK
jgi:hypothetical protein